MTMPSPIEDLARLLSEKPGLVTALQAAAGAGEATEALIRIAGENGIAVDRDQLAAHCARMAATSGDALSDDELDRISGGLNRTEFIIMSIFTGGLGCMIHTAVAASGGNQCVPTDGGRLRPIESPRR
ncbi:hypothetical protein [Azospirillum thermophilum]|uniref:Nif11 domain-containing protein n=1 Tax=Azospirillum thermophilum TaxID=2202148 RepID=A0A2S2CS43_9PROT|nr:hypothetical protein [Azospirillum thermophilum]AWK87343.1 hypothetical protein DEW08_14945 [Azospirillum thermophilum]